jgi:hypothetical protein
LAGVRRPAVFGRYVVLDSSTSAIIAHRKIVTLAMALLFLVCVLLFVVIPTFLV